jgi:hypothetical protein
MSEVGVQARVLAALPAALVLLALLLPRDASAGVPRPYDAPAAPAQRAAVPEVTPEYASIDEAGIKLVYHPLARERAHALLTRAIAVRAELTAQLGREVLGAVEIRVAAAPAQMTGLSPVELPPGITAAAFSDAHLVVMSLASPSSLEPPDLDEWMRHELAHLALDEAILGHDVPRWFHEGYAVHVSGEDAAQRAETLALASLRDRVLALRDVEARFPDGPPGASIAAAQAADFARFLVERQGRERFPALIERLRAGEAFERALPAAYGGDLGRIELLWRREMARRYSFVPVFAGAMIVWIVVALGVLARRRRLALAPPRERPVEGRRPRPSRAAPARPSLAPLPSLAVARAVAAEYVEDEGGEPIPPDPEVPKVEHDGRWYTLH